MKNFDRKFDKLLSFFFFYVLFLCPALCQDFNAKKHISTDEITFLKATLKQIAETDQLYRNYLANGTLDDDLIEEMDAVYERDGIEAYLKYQKSLDLSLEPALEDSLWQLQHEIDLRNHLTLRGIIETYGYLPNEIMGKEKYVPLLLLMHPPKDWKPAEYLAEYSVIFLEEVKAERMPAEVFAKFYDNIKGKILREPQLYGTNQQFDKKTNKILPPVIEDLDRSNEARVAIGLPKLAEGEYRLWDDK